MPRARELEIGFGPYSPVGRGYLAGQVRTLKDLAEHDDRRSSPSSSEENLAANRALRGTVARIATQRGCKPAQAALALVLAQRRDVMPILGTRSVENLEENAGALELSGDQLPSLDGLASRVARERFSPQAMRYVERESEGASWLPWRRDANRVWPAAAVPMLPVGRWQRILPLGPMQHFVLLYYALSFTTGCVSIGIALLLHRQYHKRVLLYYALFLAALAVILASLVGSLYVGAAGLRPAAALDAVLAALDKAGAFLMTFSLPLFVHCLLGLPPAARGRVPLVLPAAGVAVLSVLSFLFPDSLAVLAGGLSLFYGTAAGCLILLAVSLPRIPDPTLRRVLAVFFLVSLAFFPVLLIEILRPRLAGLPALRGWEWFELFSLPSYFFVLNVLSIVLSIRYFDRPAYLSGRRPTEHFRQRFGVTAREGEVAALLVEGMSYNQIAERLFISYKTGDNHVRHLYEKTGVRNRLQLLNLLQANQGG